MYHEYRRGPDGKRRKFYCVQWPKVGQGRYRQYFKDYQEARKLRDQKLEERGKYGVAHLAFSDKQRIEYAEAIDALRPFGKGLMDAIEHYTAYLKASEQSCTVAALVDETIAAKKKACGKRELPASERYMADLSGRLGRFKKDFSERIVATITKEELTDWLTGLKDESTGENLSPQSRGNYARCIGVAFSYAADRKYVPTQHVLKEIKKPTSSDRPEVLTVEQAGRLLEAASPELLPYIAIGLFAGLRVSEIERLDWQHISFEENEIEVCEVDGESHKSARHVDMLPNLREWLLPLRKLSGAIVPANFRKHFDSARVAAGIKEDWPDNALRHSFGSYHLKHFNNDALTRLQMGHWRDSTVLFANYRRAVTRRNAERYWNLRPTTTENIVRLVA